MEIGWVWREKEKHNPGKRMLEACWTLTQWLSITSLMKTNKSKPIRSKEICRFSFILPFPEEQRDYGYFAYLYRILHFLCFQNRWNTCLTHVNVLRKFDKIELVCVSTICRICGYFGSNRWGTLKCIRRTIGVQEQFFETIDFCPFQLLNQVQWLWFFCNVSWNCKHEMVVLSAHIPIYSNST